MTAGQLKVPKYQINQYQTRSNGKSHIKRYVLASQKSQEPFILKLTYLHQKKLRPPVHILPPDSKGGKREFGFSWADDVDHEFYGGNPSAVAYAEVETANKVTDPKTGPTTSLSSGENSPTEKEVEKLADPAGMVPANGSSQTPHDPWWEESSSGQKSHKASVSHDPSINPTVDEGEYSLEWRPSVVNFNPAGPTPLPQSKTRNRRRFKQHSKQTGAVRPSYE